MVPKGFRRPQQTPPPEDDDEMIIDPLIPEELIQSSEPTPSEAAPKQRRKVRKGPRWTHKRKPEQPAPASEQVVATDTPLPEDAKEEPIKPTLTVTVPPLSSLLPTAVDVPVDPDEPRYCYCDQVSYGEVSTFCISRYALILTEISR